MKAHINIVSYKIDCTISTIFGVIESPRCLTVGSHAQYTSAIQNKLNEEKVI